MKIYTVNVDEFGNKRWYFNDKLHCEHGPAVESADGTKFWFLNGVEYTEANWRKQLKADWRKQLKADGVKYKLVVEK